MRRAPLFRPGQGLPLTLAVANADQSQKGRAARDAGQSLEADIRAASAWYAAQDLGCLEDIPVETFGKNGERKFKGGASRIDFVGMMKRERALFDHRLMIFDAKSLRGAATFTYSHPKNDQLRAKMAKQVERLLTWERLGAVAGYLVVDRAAGPTGAAFFLWAHTLAPFSELKAVAGVMQPSVPVRTLNRDGTITSPHPWAPLPAERDVLAGRVPAIPLRSFVWPGADDRQ